LFYIELTGLSDLIFLRLQVVLCRFKAGVALIDEYVNKVIDKIQNDFLLLWGYFNILIHLHFNMMEQDLLLNGYTSVSQGSVLRKEKKEVTVTKSKLKLSDIIHKKTH